MTDYEISANSDAVLLMYRAMAGGLASVADAHGSDPNKAVLIAAAIVMLIGNLGKLNPKIPLVIQEMIQ